MHNVNRILMRAVPIMFIVALIIFSASLYGAFCYKGFNADLAIHVLMLENFQLPQDLYYWGQDRLGSIIPMIGAVLHFFNVAPITAASVAQYGLLISSFLLFQSLLKHGWFKVLLALIIFLPHSAFQAQVLIGHPYIGHFFFLTLFLVFWYQTDITYRYRLPGLLLSVVAMLWSSEIALTNLLAFMWVYRREVFLQISNRKHIPWIVGSLIVGGAFLTIAKVYASSDARYLQFLANYSEIRLAIESLQNFLMQVATFDTNKTPNHWLLFAFAILIVTIVFRFSPPPSISRFFILSAVLSFVLVLFSKWAALNGHPLRYYTPAYLQLLLAILFYIDKNPIPQIVLSFAAICLLTSWSGLYLIRNFSHEVDERLNRQEAIDISNMGEFGLIGSYWNTYSVAALSEKVDATPQQYTYVRAPKLVPQVFAHDSIMVIRNGFLETFPDTLQQFGHLLIKQGSEGSLHEFEWAFYREIK